MPAELMVICAQSWLKFDIMTGQMITEKVYEDRQILKHLYIDGQFSLLQVISHLCRTVFPHY